MPAQAEGSLESPSYFLVSVSTRENLELCVKHGLAGFPSGESGAWTFCEIQEGDFVSFLYGARAHNLYKVIGRESLQKAETLPPWPLLRFKETGKTYSFPFRLRLRPVRVFDEPLVRAEFSYVAENLLLRGGYSKTHFQADQTTLQSVSGMGEVAEGTTAALALPEHDTFVLRFTKKKELFDAPQILRFKETILQSAIRRYLINPANLQTLLNHLSLSNIRATELEILGEKAFPEGHIDLLLKQRVPLGSSMRLPIEVKTKTGQAKDMSQVSGYLKELPQETPCGILIAADFNKTVIKAAAENRIRLVRYKLNADLSKAQTFEEICTSLTLQPLT